MARRDVDPVKPPPPAEVLDYLEQVVARLERLGDRLEAYVEPPERKSSDSAPSS